MDMACLLVCDGFPLLHFIQNGERIQSLQTPTVIQSVKCIYKMIYMKMAINHIICSYALATF
jgi:hypothetical protein